MPYTYEETCKRLDDNARSGAQAVCFTAVDVEEHAARFKDAGHQVQKIGAAAIIITTLPKYKPAEKHCESVVEVPSISAPTPTTAT